jgi:hypothetical protein
MLMYRHGSGGSVTELVPTRERFARARTRAND